MKRRFLTDEEVEKELEQLRESPYVRLARREQRLKNKYRQQLYQLRMYEKRGKELAAMGLTVETLDEYILQAEKEEAEMER